MKKHTLACVWAIAFGIMSVVFVVQGVRGDAHISSYQACSAASMQSMHILNARYQGTPRSVVEEWVRRNVVNPETRNGYIIVIEAAWNMPMPTGEENRLDLIERFGLAIYRQCMKAFEISL